MNYDYATLGTGCFWCTEAIFSSLKGVISVESGYAGGEIPNPSYEDICSGNSGYAEVVHIQFDPNSLSYKDLLKFFWSSHDPTTLNRQGNDVGTQYRSVIFFHDEEQEQIAKQSLSEISSSNIFDKPIVTEITQLVNYYPAEDYHQKYYENVGNRNPYCAIVITPKLQKFRKEFEDFIKK